MPRRVLVGFDGGPASCVALRRAVGLACREHGTLTVVSVLGRSPMTAYCWMGPMVPRPDFEGDAQACLRRTVDRLPARLSVTWLVRHGDAARVLAEEAERRCCDAIVVGPRFTAWRLRQLTDVPVIAVRRKRRRRRREPTGAAAPRARAAI